MVKWLQIYWISRRNVGNLLRFGCIRTFSDNPQLTIWTIMEASYYCMCCWEILARFNYFPVTVKRIYLSRNQAGHRIGYCSSSSYWSKVWKECNNNIWTLSRELGPKGSANVVQKQHLLFYDLKDAVSNYALLFPSSFLVKRHTYSLEREHSRFSRYICQAK